MGCDPNDTERFSAISTHEHTPSDLRILLVDDDRNLLETTSVLLGDEATVMTSTGGKEALRLVSEREVHVVCADFRMPEMNGLELLRSVHRMDQRTIGVLITGFREQLPKGVAGDPAVFALLYKPYKLSELLSTIREAARRAAMARSNRSPKSF